MESDVDFFINVDVLYCRALQLQIYFILELSFRGVCWGGEGIVTCWQTELCYELFKIKQLDLKCWDLIVHTAVHAKFYFENHDQN